jgi:zinc protease
LPNRLRVLLIERRSDPLVTLHAMVMVGAAEDPRGGAGTAQFVAALLTKGTVKRSATELAKAIDDAGGTMHSGAGWDETIAGVSVLADRKSLAFDLLSDILIHPRFAPSEMARYRKQTISALRILKDDPHYVAHTVAREALLAGTPYAHPPEGTEATLGSITRQDLENFYAKYFDPANTVLAVEGDVTPQQGLRLAEKYFGKWSGREAAPLAMRRAIHPKPMRGVILIQQSDAAETEIRVGYVGIARANSGYDSLEVANEALGGPAGNRLFFVLRTRLGLAYSASSALHCYRRLGTWVAKTSTPTADGIRAVTEMLAQIRRLRARPVSEAELQMAHHYLVGHLALRFESPNEIADHFLELMLYGLPLDSWNAYAKRIRAITRAGVLSAAASVLHRKDRVIVLVGNVASDAGKLRKLAPVRVIPLSQLDLGAPGLKKSKPPATADRAGNP